MSWEAFVVLMVRALAWPLVTLGIFLAVRRPLIGLLQLVTKIKYGDVEFSFALGVREVVAKATSLSPESVNHASALAPQRLRELGLLSPRSAILESWIPVERAARDLASRNAIRVNGGSKSTASSLVDALANARVMTEDERAIFLSLRRLRNQAAHAPAFALPFHEVEQFINVAHWLASRLSNLRGAPSDDDRGLAHGAEALRS